ncbi:MAG TPA: hypothetical protein VF898_09165 [Chloroflexota bacterium]
MRCFHCNNENPDTLPFDRPLDGGRAFAQVCLACGHSLGIRPRIDDDPPITPVGLSDQEMARLRFLQWRLKSMPYSEDQPLSAA